MFCLPHGHPRMWLGAEDSRIPGHHCWASRGGQPEEAEWLGPSPRAQGLGLEIPAPAFSPPASVCPVGDPGWSLPRLCVSLLSFTLHVLSVWAFCFCMFLSAPPVLGPLPCPMPSASLSCPTPIPCHAFCFSVPSASSLPAFVPFAPSANSFMLQKRKKGGRDRNTKKAQTKTNLECVAKCCVLLVASVCPCGLQPARPPYPSAVCPARLPALPLLPMTRSSVPGCLVMVPDV